MDPNESGGLSSYFHHQQPPSPSPLNPAAGAGSGSGALVTLNTSPTNGILPNTSNNPATTTNTSSPLVYGTVPSAVSSGGGLESGKRKRGRPRKYGTPGEAAAARRLSSASTTSGPISPLKKKELAFNSGTGGSSSSYSYKKHQLAALGTAGQSFTPHVITVAAGEDVGQKIMFFLQQSKCEICVLSASGSVSNASLRQPATSGGSVTYEGQFDILSLCGSYVRTELGGRTGGLSVCLSSTSDGQIIGGGVGGPLTAAGPIQVIVGTFLIDPKKDITGGLKGETSAGKSPSSFSGASFSGVSIQSPIDSYQNTGGSQFVIQPGSIHAPSQLMEWSNHPGRNMQQYPENGNYEHNAD